MNNRARTIAFILIALTAAAIFTTAIWRATVTRRHHVDVDRTRYPIIGLDLSAHNGDIDFNKVASDSIVFVYLKASEGCNHRDPRFRAYHAAAQAAGLKTGAYHFFRLDLDGYAQARNFLEAIDSLSLDLPLAIDVEEWGNAGEYDAASASDALRGLVIALEGAGHKPIIYTNKQGYGRFIRRHLDDLPLWVCSFTNPPVAGDWLLWQHSHLSRVSGIKGNVDLNTFNGDCAAWEQWLGSHIVEPSQCNNPQSRPLID